MGHKGGLITPAPGAENAEPVVQIPVGLPCLGRGRCNKKLFDLGPGVSLDLIHEDTGHPKLPRFKMTQKTHVECASMIPRA